MNEGLELAQPQDLIPQPTAPSPPEAAPPAKPSGPSWLRLAYSIEFLLALIAAYLLWSEVGGQGHLDMMPWYPKLLCGLAMAWCSVRLTAGMVEQERAWNPTTRRWFAGLMAVAILMGGLTLYYHLHEQSDQPENDDSTETSVRVALPPIGLDQSSDRADG